MQRPQTVGNSPVSANVAASSSSPAGSAARVENELNRGVAKRANVSEPPAANAKVQCRALNGLRPGSHARKQCGRVTQNSDGLCHNHTNAPLNDMVNDADGGRRATSAPTRTLDAYVSPQRTIDMTAANFELCSSEMGFIKFSG